MRRREIRVPPRLWWGFWSFASAFFLGANASVFVRTVAALPHDHVANTTSATISFVMAIVMLINLRTSMTAFMFATVRRGS